MVVVLGRQVPGRISRRSRASGEPCAASSLHLALASCFTALAVSPANAADNESGTPYFQSAYTPRAAASAIGNLYLKGPGDASYAFFYIAGTTYQTRTNVGPGVLARRHRRAGLTQSCGHLRPLHLRLLRVHRPATARLVGIVFVALVLPACSGSPADQIAPSTTAGSAGPSLSRQDEYRLGLEWRDRLLACYRTEGLEITEIPGGVGSISVLRD